MADLVKSSNALDAAAFAARVGSVIKGKWTIEALLGVGGMAAVYAAVHRNGKRVALKILHASLADDRTVCERFLREAYVSNQVNHSATVEVMDDDVTDQGEPFLIMDLLDGETVRDEWKRTGRAMPLGRVLQIAERIADCLASCHAMGIIHRDLKPANVFVTRAGEIKLIDFGVAQMRTLAGESSAAGTALGTPAYMSPEQAMGLVDQLDGRSDLFSLGAMLHALSTGHRIHHARTEQEALVLAATKPVPSVERVGAHLPSDVVMTIDKALSWDRRKRFKDAREMQATLLALMHTHGVAPLPSRPAPRPMDVATAPSPLSSGPVLPSSAEPGSPQVKSQVVATGSVPSQDTGMSPSAYPGPELAAGAVVIARMHWSAPPNADAADPRALSLRARMKSWDSVLSSARRLGLSHDTTELALHECFEALSDALEEDRAALELLVSPVGLLSSGQVVWEPVAPFDKLASELFASGLRKLRIEPGLTLDELRSFFVTCVTCGTSATEALGPSGDSTAARDVGEALWDQGLRHLKFEFAPSSASLDTATLEVLHAELSRIEARVLDAGPHGDEVSRVDAKASAEFFAENATRPSASAIDPVVRDALIAELTEEGRVGWTADGARGACGAVEASASRRELVQVHGPSLVVALRDALVAKPSTGAPAVEALHHALSAVAAGFDDNVTLFVAPFVAVVCGHLVEGPRSVHAAAGELSSQLEALGGAELVFSRGLTVDELAEAVARIGAAAAAGERVVDLTETKLSLRPAPGSSRFFEPACEAVSAERAIVRAFASTAFAVRRLTRAMPDGRAVSVQVHQVHDVHPVHEVHDVHIAARSIVDVARAGALTVLRKAVRAGETDPAARRVYVAMLAVLVARELTADRTLLRSLASTILLGDAVNDSRSMGARIVPIVTQFLDRIAPGSDAAAEGLDEAVSSIAPTLAEPRDRAILRVLASALSLRAIETIPPPAPSELGLVAPPPGVTAPSEEVPSALSLHDMAGLLEVASEIEERGARAAGRVAVTLPEEPTAHGSLALTPIPHVLVYMLDHVLSGTVVLEGLPGDNAMYFADGVPVKAYLAEPVALLGEVFVNAGLASTDIIERALLEARDRGVLLGQHLVEREIVTQEQLAWALETQLLQNLTKLANLPETVTYAYYGDVDLLEGWGDDSFAPSSPLNPIVVTIRHWMEDARMRATLARFRGRPLVLHAHAEIDALALLADEQAVLETIRHASPSFDELILLGLAPEATVTSLVYTLAMTRQFEFTGKANGPMGLRARARHASFSPESVKPLASVRPSPASAAPPVPSASAVPVVASAPELPLVRPSPVPPASSRAAKPASAPPRESASPRAVGSTRPRAPAIRPIAKGPLAHPSGTESPKAPRIRPTGAVRTTLVTQPRTASIPPDMIDSEWSSPDLLGASAASTATGDRPSERSGPLNLRTTTKLDRDAILRAKAAMDASDTFTSTEAATAKRELADAISEDHASDAPKA